MALVFDSGAKIYSRNGINFETLSHLDSIGLIQFNDLTGFSKIKLSKSLVLHYYGRPLHLNLSKDVNNELDIGKVLLTRIGEELAPICRSKPVEGFWEVCERQMEKLLAEASDRKEIRFGFGHHEDTITMTE